MSIIVRYDDAAVPVQNQVKQWLEGEPFAYEGKQGFVTFYERYDKNGDLIKQSLVDYENAKTLLSSVDLKYLKIDLDNVVEMSGKERADIDAAEAAAKAAAGAALIAAFDDLFFNAKVIDFDLSKADSIIDSAQSVDDLKFLLKRMMRFLFTLWTGLKGKLQLPPE
jgi:hypothetical protein